MANAQRLSREVTALLDQLNHPMRSEIDTLRNVILDASEQLDENVKWNGPNYSIGADDRITLKVQPAKQVQIIFHRGAKKQQQPSKKLIDTKNPLFVWKENDRAVVTLKTAKDTESFLKDLSGIVKDWLVNAEK